MSSRGPVIIATSIVFTVLAVFSVATRFIARIVFLKNAGGDEVAILGSMICAIGLLVATLEQEKHGLGKHFSAVSTAEFSEVLKCLWVAIILYNISLTLTKLSIVLQYLRVFVGPRIRYSCWAAIAIITLYGLETIISAVWTCVPISAFWTADPTAHCLNKKFLWFFNAAMNLLTDLIIFTLPMPALSALLLPKKQKIGLMFVFGLGGFVCLVSVLRLHALYVVSNSTDITWDNTDAAIWSIIEVDTGIICASLPTIKPVVSRLFPRLLSSNRSRQPTQPYHTYPTSGFHSSNPCSDPFSGAGIRLDDIESPPSKTVTKIEASERRAEDVRMAKTTDEHGRDIFVTTSVAMDVESKSEIGSEKDLIFQR